MPNNDTTTKFKVDISDLKKNIQEANRLIRLANAEFKAASAGMGDWSKSADGLSAKIASLQKVLSAQETKLSDYRKQLELIVKEYGESSKEADEMRIKVLNQEAVVRRTEASLRGYAEQLEDLGSGAKTAGGAFEDLQEAIEKQQKKLDGLKGQYKSVVLEQGKGSDAARELAKEIEDLSGELADNKRAMEGLDQAANDLDKAFDDTDPSGLAEGFTVLKGALADLVADGIRAATDALRDFATETVRVGADFEAAMSEVGAISGATGEDLEYLRDTAKAVGEDDSIIYTATESAEALKYMALAGWDAQTSAEALGGVLSLAASSGMDLAEASDMVTDYMSAFGLEAKESARFADLLAFAQSHANTTAEDLGEAYKNSAANLHAAGQDVETVTSLLAMMANQGLKGSEAGTALSAVMRDLTAKMKDGSIRIGETAVAVQDAQGNYRDLTDILSDVEAATAGMGDAERATALQASFTADSIKGLNLILNAGVKPAEEFENALRASSGTAEDMAEAMTDNLSGDMEKLNKQVEALQLEIAEGLTPALRVGVEALGGLLDAFGFLVEHGSAVMATLAGVTAGVAAYVAFTTALKVMREGWMALEIVQKAVTAGQWLLNAAMAANPIGIVIALIAALVAAFIVLWNTSEDFRNFFINMWKGIKDALGPIIDAIVDFFKSAWDAICHAWDSAVGFFSGIWEGIKYVFSAVSAWFGGIFSSAASAVQNAFGWITGFFAGIWEAITGIFSGVADWFGGIFSGAAEIINGVFSGVVGGIKGVINWLIEKVNGFIDFANKIKIPEGVPLIGGIGINLKRIPLLASGGVLQRGQMGLLEGSGAEAVVPLENNRKWIAAVVSEMRRQEGASKPGAGGAVTGGGTTYNFVQNNTSPKALSRLELYRQTKAQLQFAKGV